MRDVFRWDTDAAIVVGLVRYREKGRDRGELCARRTIYRTSLSFRIPSMSTLTLLTTVATHVLIYLLHIRVRFSLHLGQIPD